MAFVRKSKFRHVFGQTAKKENAYEGFRVTNCAFEGTFIAANGKYIAFCVEVGGGGAFVVIPVEKKGRLDVNIPKISAHKEYVLDLQWNPYNDNMLASCSEDGSIKIWAIPENGILTNWEDDKALLCLEYHERRCVQLAWHPSAMNVILSVSQEPKVCVWNLDDGSVETEIDGTEVIWNAAWSNKGDKIVTSSKDKKLRIYDARTGAMLKEGDGHEGSKAQRVIFTFDDRFLFSCGFSRMSERQYACWDADTMTELNMGELDTANGCLIPYYDGDNKIIYIGAKGDSVIRYYELVDEDPYFHYIDTFQSSAAQRGLAPIPKRSVTVNDCEVMRFYKLHGTKTGYIEPISFTVPRKSDIYQDDLYPDCVSDEAAVEACDWFAGKDVLPNRMDMSTKFIGKAKPKKAAGGGLKKGGLKGLKAKKDAKEAAKTNEAAKDEAPSVEPAEGKKAKEESKPAPQPVKQAAAPAQASPGVDPKVIDSLRNEITELKMKDKRRDKDMKEMSAKLKDYDKYVNDLKLLVDAVKKNDERIAALEALVQEESDEEEEEA